MKMIMIVIWLLSGTVYASQDRFPFDDSYKAKRFATLLAQTRCVVCQNQNLTDSNAPIANDLRHKIYTLLLTNKSDQEIKDYLVKRYGDFILLQPRFKGTTFFLWLFPLMGISLASVFLFKIMKKA